MADIRLLSEIRITIRSLGGGSDDDSGQAESVVRKDGPFDRWDSAQDSQPPDRRLSQDRSGYGEGGADANNIFPSDVLASASQDG